jgi:hypothetical protein
MSKTRIIIEKEYLIEKYLNKRKNIGQIAKEINCSQPTIRYNLIRFNIRLRTR